MSKEGRLNLRIDATLLKRMKEYARRRNVTISSLVVGCFEERLKEEAVTLGVEETVDAEQI
jgi:predicted HicB family RNase H-like nuclease